MPAINPFSATELELARQLVKAADDVLAFASQCERCKLDMTGVRERVNELRDFAQGVLTEFGGITDEGHH